MTKLAAIVSVAGLLGAASNPDLKREQQYSDRLRKAQREYIRIMGDFDKWCSARGQRVGTKGAQGDLGCVAAQTQALTPGTGAGKAEDKK